jgi:ribonucleoside-triphosphate reductase
MSNYLPTLYQQYIHLSRYSRWLHDENRRETWEETVSRYFNFFEVHLEENNGYTLQKDLRDELEQAVLSLDVMPSMRAMMTAGEALKKDNIAGYNCAFLSIDKAVSFDEAMYILMNGTGVGFSVEEEFTNKLGSIADEFNDTDTTIVVADSKLGWAKALKELVGMLYVGQIPKWDVTKVRPAGMPLKTFGGRASGPEPLEDLFRFCVHIFRHAAGRKLTTLECHDIMCKIAEIVVVGGVRRSALISLSDLFDDRMRSAKSGEWYKHDIQRALANNSATYKEKPDIGIFMDEWKSLYDSKSGERGIFSRQAAKKIVEEGGRRDPNYEFGTNPCSEIILRSREFCNLSEVVVRPSDNDESLSRKVRLATILGTFQSTLTNFKYISKEWKKNCEEERLLGVSLTGIMDSTLTNGKDNRLAERLEGLRKIAVDVNKDLAADIGINQSAAITCVKPSGTVSQLVDSASGIHARHNPYYVRTVRGDKKDPLTKMMIDAGFPAESDVTKPDSTTVFSFPVKCDSDSVFRTDMTAIEQLELWKTYQMHWCEHKPSVTISVKEHEWLEVGAWVYENFDYMSGVSFLPFSDFIYKQAPYQDCSEEEYEQLLAKMPKEVDWKKLSEYEKDDHTIASQELACSAGGCEIL